MKVCNIAILFGRKLMKNLIKILIILINCLAAAESGVPGARPGGNLKFWIDSSLIITIWWFCPKLKSNYKTIYLHKIVISYRNLFWRDLKNRFSIEFFDLLSILLNFANIFLHLPGMFSSVTSSVKLQNCAWLLRIQPGVNLI